VSQPNQNWAPQLGIAWDPSKNGKTVIRAGAGLFYENVIFNNVLFDRPLREPNGAFLYATAPCFGGSGFPLAIPGGTIVPAATDCGTASGGLATIAATANGVASLETQLKAAYPFSPGLVNGSYVGGALAAGQAPALGLFAPNYVSPRSVQMNIGIQREIRHGMVLTADFLRNVETHALLGQDINHVGDIADFNSTGAADAVMGAASTYSPDGTTMPCNGLAGSAAVGCLDGFAIQAPTAAAPNLGAAGVAGAYLGNGLGTPGDATGVACLNSAAGGVGHPCAFGGINQNYNAMLFLKPISRSVYNGLQMKLVENVTNPLKGVNAANFQLSYALSKFVNPVAFQGLAAPSNAVAANDQDFVLQAADNDNPLRYMGPSLLDRTHQLSFGGNIDVPFHFRLGIIAHFYSPLSSPTIVGSTGSAGQIFQTDFTGSGFVSDPLPGTKNGAFGRSLNVNGLNNAISSYNTSQGNLPTPAGQQLVAAGLFTPGQLADVGLVAPLLSPAPPNQLPFTWTKALDFKIAWEGKIKERFTIEPSVGFYNLFNFSNYDLPPGVMTGWLNQGSNSINSTAKGFNGTSVQSDSYRVGVGTGVFGLGGPRVMEFQLKISF
jgi:hypothetical protein